jgi:hypothetical protein
MDLGRYLHHDLPKSPLHERVDALTLSISNEPKELRDVIIHQGDNVTPPVVGSIATPRHKASAVVKAAPDQQTQAPPMQPEPSHNLI